jgi:hypothetical protein
MALNLEAGYVVTTAANRTGTTNVTITALNIQDGDFLYMWMHHEDVAVTAPAGWNDLGAIDDPVHNFDATAWWKIASGEGTTVTISHAFSFTQVGVGRITGNPTTDPLDAGGSWLVSSGGGGSVQAQFTGVTTTQPNSGLIAIHVTFDDRTRSNWTSPLVNQISTNGQMGLAVGIQAAQGASGSKTADLSGNSSNMGLLFAVKEAAPTQRAYALSDVSDGSWLTNAGSATLYAAIDETTASDADFIQSSASPASADVCEIQFQALNDPSSSAGHNVSYRYQKDVAAGDQINLTVRLMQGATEIAAWTHTNIGLGWTGVTQTLTGTQADAITNYGDLRLRFEAIKV